jgi:hypothetical protein
MSRSPRGSASRLIRSQQPFRVRAVGPDGANPKGSRFGVGGYRRRLRARLGRVSLLLIARGSGMEAEGTGSWGNSPAIDNPSRCGRARTWLKTIGPMLSRLVPALRRQGEMLSAL